MHLPLAALAFVAATTVAHGFSADPLPRISLRGGEPRLVAETGVTVEVTNIQDSRCPADVDCVWEGMVRVELTVTAPQSRPQQIILCNQCNDAEAMAEAGGLTIGYIGLQPSTADLAKLGRLPDLSDYEVTLFYAPAKD